ncbi:MAG: hypothetical protein PHD26_08325 [Methanosarcinaceae archaeon]|nr:hypothetical protein [Methanosarcinaceae archaeon]
MTSNKTGKHRKKDGWILKDGLRACRRVDSKAFFSGLLRKKPKEIKSGLDPREQIRQNRI